MAMGLESGKSGGVRPSMNVTPLVDVVLVLLMSLPPGTYNLRVWAELKAGRRISSVVVEKGKTTRIDASLGEDTKAVMQLAVVAKPDTATEAVQLVRRQKSAAVSDAISADKLSRTPDANASEAVKRVVGATIQDNKYVVIRGLAGALQPDLAQRRPASKPRSGSAQRAARSVPGGAARQPHGGKDILARSPGVVGRRRAVDRNARLPLALHAQVAPRNRGRFDGDVPRGQHPQGRFARLPRIRRRDARVAIGDPPVTGRPRASITRQDSSRPNSSR